MQMVSSHFHLYRTLSLSLFIFNAYSIFWKDSSQKDHHISMIGAGMGSRMIHYGHFETEMQLRFLIIDWLSEICVMRETLLDFGRTQES